jgi:hypothetical protein
LLSGPGVRSISRGRPLVWVTRSISLIWLAVLGWDKRIPAESLLQWVHELYFAVRKQGGQHCARERLGDGADAQQRLAIRRTIALSARFAKSRNRHFAVANSADH